MSRATRMTADERRAAIVAATLPLLLERGPDLSTREIAQAAGIAEGTIFRVFETKNDLIQATVAEAMRPTATLAALAELGDQDLTERVASVMAILAGDLQRIRSLFSHLARAGLAPHHGPGHEGKKPPHGADGRAEVLDAAAAALEPYADQLSIPTMTAARLLSALSFATSFALDTEASSPPDPHNLARLALHGIAIGEK